MKAKPDNVSRRIDLFCSDCRTVKSLFSLNRRCEVVFVPAFLILLGLSLTSCGDTASSPSEPVLREVSGSTMGTSWSMLWVEDSDITTVEESLMQEELEAELQRINALMSTWNPESELSLFNQSEQTDSVRLHPDTLKVIDTALHISRLTDGRYDITLGPVIDLWGFGRSTQTPTPSDQAIESALVLSGFDSLVRKNNTLQKRLPGVSVDVSSLAKGYAVDQLGEVAEALGINDYLVDIGGELRARGTRADGNLWRVGIENPRGEVPQALALSNQSIASSGSYRNFRIENGLRVSHIIDGSSGRPITHRLVSVSVVHKNTMLADAWATALLVVGFEDAQKLIMQQGLTAQLTISQENHFESVESAQFAAALIK